MGTEDKDLDKGDDFKVTEAEEVVEGKVVEAKVEEKVEEEKGPKKDRMVPETRLSEVVRKAKDREAALVQQIAEMEKERDASTKDADLSTIEKRISELDDQIDAFAKDGKDADAKAARAEQRRLERALVRAEADEKAGQARIAAVEELRYETTINRLEAQFPIINEDHDDYDEDLAQEVILLRNSLRKEGLTPAKALEKAVGYVTKAHSIKPLGEEDPADKRTRREKEARKLAAEADKQQPGDLNKRGLDSDKGGSTVDTTNIARMSQDKFAKLDEDTLSRIRGDTL